MNDVDPGIREQRRLVGLMVWNPKNETPEQYDARMAIIRPQYERLTEQLWKRYVDSADKAP